MSEHRPTSDVEITGGKLAQAFGCEPDNYCHTECSESWQDAWDQDWSSMSESERSELTSAVEWINQRRWIGENA